MAKTAKSQSGHNLPNDQNTRKGYNLSKAQTTQKDQSAYNLSQAQNTLKRHNNHTHHTASMAKTATAQNGHNLPKAQNTHTAHNSHTHKNTRNGQNSYSPEFLQP